MTSTITGDAELKRKLAKLKDLSLLVRPLAEGAAHIKDRISKPGGYPPSGPGNQPGGAGSSWYERGYGSRWQRMDGSMGGKKTSEDLGLSWGVAAENSGLRQVIGNDTSYGPWVQGANDQSTVMAEIGWKTTDDVMYEEEQAVLDRVKARVDQILATG